MINNVACKWYDPCKLKIFPLFQHVCAGPQMKLILLIFFNPQQPQAINSTNPDPLLIKHSLRYWDVNKMVDILQKAVSILFSSN